MKELNLPPLWCSQICRNAMNESCLEKCAIKKDCSAFQPKRGLKFTDLPRFPDTANMSREEKFTSVTIYLAKIVDHLQGEPDEYIPFRRQNIHSQAGSRLSPIVQVKDLLPDLAQAISPLEVGEECKSERVGPAKVAQSAD